MATIDKRIIPLAIGGLGIGTTEFTIMGLLPDIAKTLQISIPEAGHLISAYALGVVIGAPILIGYSVKFPPKKVLMSLMVIFTVFNALSAIASDYSMMLVIRFLSGLPHGAFFGVGTVMASRMGGKGKEAFYISLMFTGLTIANLAMVPLVTYIGHTFHWRWYFAIVAVIGLIALLFLKLWLPDLRTNQNTHFMEELKFLKGKQAWLVLMITAIGFGGLFTWFSYITPLMTVVAGIKSSQMAYVMVIAGVGMVAGNLGGGVLSDRMSPEKTCSLLLFLMMFSLAGVFFFSQYQNIALILTFVCGALSMSVASPINIMMMKAAPKSEMMAAAFMQAAFNIANAMGAFLGGIPLEHGYTFNYPSLVGVVMTGIGLAISLRYKYVYASKSTSDINASGNPTYNRQH
ncbi:MULTISPECIES: MFS transporter [Chryseobacterium]|uniref:DHA1 family arabinose polymer transporter-like MFS transporter n=1 Tax=Chryseobacterium camelliae TaxID=1265445 RepID=A0ABU0TJ76_9FLAO|nr:MULTISPECIES: MFS transporter [Chryseobacterium]MDT3409028.1 DHA1 family arabinose polymer transporter-like MFS transporter [Pseudacidovorax intermedius]MDQ1097114.1 DHA1 family arabinose polymer transporter-like MFS transporter [Chryseobacterium camelliae]MDQ1101051.1 DHA1 family arabinose polymer transporter-like MFS transporter [Chryseobacterium sp. SORGH_AS_1048]MDR6084494.1 DHA1 family arabinose polymer transporter-like MFS transporter [Chryseobacterium sp. SORGH_AS_0909]MDR6132764.1 D